MYRFHLFLPIIYLFLLHVVRAQRGGYRGSGSGSGWQGISGNDEESGSDGDGVQGIITETQTQVQLQTQVQTRTMISTATAIATATATATAISQSLVQIKVPTTIIQATTVVSVRTALLSSSSPPSSISSTTSSDIEGLTVDVNPSSSSSIPIPIPATDPQSSTTKIGAASEVSAPVTSLNGSVPSLLNGMDLKTTGVPNLGNGRGDQSVVYGHTTSSGSSRRPEKCIGSLRRVLLGLSGLFVVARF